MISVITRERCENSKDLWSCKLQGSFCEGQSEVTKCAVLGRVEIRELGGRLRVCFLNVKLTQAELPKTEEEGEKEKENDLDDSSDSDPENSKQTVDTGPFILPSLTVFLTTKRPKQRMVDIHREGFRLPLVGRKEDSFAVMDEESSFEVPLTDVSDVSGIQGLVVCKIPDANPVTSEPTVFGFVRFALARSVRVRSLDALSLTALSDTMRRLQERDRIRRDSLILGPHSKRLLKPLRVYRDQASLAWKRCGKREDERAKASELQQLLSALDIFVLDIQAKRCLDAIDLRKEGVISVEDFENFLIVRDLLQPIAGEITDLDVFDTLKSVPIRAADAAQQHNDRNSKTKGDTTEPAVNSAKSVPEAYVTYSKRECEGLDFASFLEAIQSLGYSMDFDEEDPQLEAREAFLSALTNKKLPEDEQSLNLAQFRRAWLKLCDVALEMKKRGIKEERGLFAGSRNRERLAQSITEISTKYLGLLKAINAYVESMKADHRRARDERRRKRKRDKEKLMHEANRFAAERTKEKRVQKQKEQEEKARKRNEDKLLRNKLLQRQSEANRERQMETAAGAQAAAAKRERDVVSAGLDLLQMPANELRDLYKTFMLKDTETQHRLSVVRLCDFSRNKLETIPEDFCFWLTSLKQFILSQNRLVHLPSALGAVNTLQILSLDSNRIVALPEDLFTSMTQLQRLNISNNRLTSLPESIGCCASLTFLSAHSNALTAIPMSLCDCLSLSYIDLSHNSLTELPEQAQQWMSLTHLDVCCNRLAQLPMHLGDCTQLRYLDISLNTLVSLPISLSFLSRLEFFDAHKNALIQAEHVFLHMSSLKSLSLCQNAIGAIAHDIGGLSSVVSLDLSLNKLTSLPSELGLCGELQTLSLAHNSLTTIPQSLGALVTLQSLSLAHNNLHDELCETLSLAAALTQLDISHNHVQSLPLSILALRDLKKLEASHNELSSLPPTLLTLERLQELNLSHNRFSVFPIELQAVQSLTALDLCGNRISLLPKDICQMKFLHSLDLSRNNLQALPVEFVDVLETVNVSFNQNPWSRLPKQWGRRFTNKEQADELEGIRPQDALHFLYCMQQLYDVAAHIWHQFAAFFMSGRLGCDDFVRELRDRLSEVTWTKALQEHAEILYFSSKESGIFVKYYLSTEEEVADQSLHLNRVIREKEHNVIKSKADERLRERLANIAYHKDLSRRMVAADARLAEHSKNEQVIDAERMRGLHINVVRAEESLLHRRVQIADDSRNSVDNEAARLREIVSVDRKVLKELRDVEKAREREELRAQSRSSRR